MILILLLMLLIGPIQVLWAIIQAIATRHSDVRKHFGFYGLGVITYFLVILILSQFDLVNFEYGLFNLHFFGGAFLLFCYHIWIVSYSVGLRNREQTQQEWV